MKKKLVPVCGWCKKVRVDETTWQEIEEYLTSQGLGESTHGMCPACSEKIFQKRIYLESYQKICKEVSSSISLNEVFNLIVTNVVKVMDVKASLLRLINKKSRTLDVAAYHGLSESYVNKGKVEFDRSIEDSLSGEPVSVYDITAHKDSKYYKEAMKEGIRTILSIPLRFKDEIIGMLRMYTDEPRDYNDEDLKFLSAIAEQAAIAIMNAKEFEMIVSKEKEYLRLFQDISKAISSSLNVEEVMSMIVRNIPKAMNLKGATIRLIEEKTKKLKYVAAYGLSDRYLSRGPVDDEKNIMKTLKQKPVAIFDVTNDPRILHHKEAIDEGIKSILIVPIKSRDDMIGILRLFAGWIRSFTQQDIDFAMSLGEQCGIAIVNAIMFEKKYKEAEYLKAMQEITRLTSKTHNFNEVLNLIVKKLPEIMNTKGATIRLINAKNNKLELVAASGLSQKYLKRGTVEYEDTIVSALKGEPVAIYDVTTDSRIVYNKEAEEEGIKSILAVPLMVYDRIIGVLRLLTDEYRTFTQDEIDFAMALAEEAAIAIDSKMKNKRRRFSIFR